MTAHLVPAFGSQQRGETASLLLAMADELGLPVRVVQRARDGYLVPIEIWERLYGISPEMSEVAPLPVVPEIAEVPQPAELPDIRTWARDNGFTVGDKGRIAASITEAYEAARAAVSSGEKLASVLED